MPRCASSSTCSVRDDPVPTRDRLRHLVAHKLVTTRQHITELQEFTGQLERVHRRLSGNPGCGCRHLVLCLVID